jgi:hypothetical protein
MMQKEDDNLHSFIFGEPFKSRIKEDVIALVLAIVGAYSEIAHHVADISLLYSVYWTGQ